MDDLGSYRVPREAQVGREVRMEERRSANRMVLFGVGGILFLCVCLCIGVALLLGSSGFNPLADVGTITLFGDAPTATPRAVARWRADAGAVLDAPCAVTTGSV